MAQERYACIYAKEYPAQAMLRLRPELRNQPCVILHGAPPTQTVCSCNARARKLGAVPGMTRVEIETFPSMTVLSRSLVEEAAAKAALLECAGTFSPRIEDRSNDTSFVCIIDIAGTQTLFGPPETLANLLSDRICKLGFAASIAISSNLHTAVCLARGMRTKITITSPGNESTALAPLPLSVLDLSPEHTATFHLWGIHTLGMLAALPEPALIARLGQEGKRLHQLALGKRPHLFLPGEPVFALTETINLDTPVELIDSLLFVIGIMLEQLILRATARILALASVTVTLSLEGEATHTRTVRPALPTNDRQLWIKLLHLDLEAHPPQAAILSLTLTAEPGHTTQVQFGLFSPKLPEADRLDVTLARIRAIVGEECVGRAVLKDTHHPEGFRIEPFTLPRGSTTELASTPPHTAMRALRPSDTATVLLKERRPHAFTFRQKRYLVDRAYGPWLTSGDWWNPTLWSHHQWDILARAEDGSPLHCCLTHDLTQHCWQMTGLYD